MRNWISSLLDAERKAACLTLRECPLQGAGTALALAPHPDDPDAVAVTLRMLQRGGWDLFWTILTSGWSGVQDSLVGRNPSAKRLAREAEQRESAMLFGLNPARLVFLRLEENERGELAITDENRDRFRSHLEELMPDIVLLPHGEDTNLTHRLTYQWFTEWADRAAHPVIALGNEDPKTQTFRPDLQLVFGQASASWKAALLECHRSQSLRNQAARGMTFAERILAVNANSAGEYAERFQVKAWRNS